MYTFRDKLPMYSLIISVIIIIAILLIRLTGTNYLSKNAILLLLVTVGIAYAATIALVQLNVYFSLLELAGDDVLDKVVEVVSPIFLVITLVLTIYSMLRLSNGIFVPFFLYNFNIFFIHSFSNRHTAKAQYDSVRRQINDSKVDDDRRII